MKRFQFQLRTVLIATLTAAVLCSYLLYLDGRDRKRLHTIRDGFIRWAQRTDRSNGKIHTYFQLNRNVDPNSLSEIQDRRAFLVSNAFMVYRPKMSKDLLFDPAGSPPDPKRFYLLPAKKWVDTPEEVLNEWDAWRNTAF